MNSNENGGYDNGNDRSKRKRRQNKPKQEPLGYPFRSAPKKATSQSLGSDYTLIQTHPAPTKPQPPYQQQQRGNQKQMSSYQQQAKPSYSPAQQKPQYQQEQSHKQQVPFGMPSTANSNHPMHNKYQHQSQRPPMNQVMNNAMSYHKPRSWYGPIRDKRPNTVYIGEPVKANSMNTAISHGNGNRIIHLTWMLSWLHAKLLWIH